ncbi:MAG: PD-(D/E)XK nuclease family protein, partial [Clostridiales bacterium]|nr:PD-(D/E)XK nuclease family protein [Clostridiales bacterium]
MSLQFILGLPGAGKTTWCLQEILRKNNEPEPGRLYYLVPEQATLQSEQKLIGLLPASAMSKVQALSFQRLAFHLFAKMGAASGAFLDGAGKSMLLRKIVLDLRGDLSFYGKAGDKPGFIEGLSRTVTEFFQYEVTADDLRRIAEHADAEFIRCKLQDLTRIFETYVREMQDRYFSLDETLDLLPDKISASTELDGAFVWIDGFHGFTKQERSVLTRILQKARYVAVTAAVEEEAISFPGLSSADFFYEAKNTLNQMTAMAIECHAAIEKPIFLRRSAEFSEMDFFLRHYPGCEPAVYPHETQKIRLTAAADREAEVKAAACAIERLTRGGARYRDIAVLTGDIPGYEKTLKRVFRQYAIPLFIDVKTDIMAHPLTELIRAALDVAARHWSYESVFRFLKTDMTGIPRDQVDTLENYALMYGVKGRQWHLKEWTYGKNREEAFAVKELARKALAPFTRGISDKKESVHDFSARIYDMLESLRVTETLERWIRERSEAGENETARQHGQIWGKISAVFDKLVEILDSEKVNAAEFGKILDAGLQSMDMGMIPPSLDQVLVGDLTRSRLPDVQALIVVGVNEGLLPRIVTENSFLTDEERDFLLRQGLELGPDGKRKAGEERFLVYSGISKPTRALILSYCVSDRGKTLRPSPLTAELARMFPRLVPEIFQEEEIVSARPMLSRMGPLLKKYAAGETLTPVQKDIYAVLREDPASAAMLDKIERFIRVNGASLELSEKSIRKLYGRELAVSASKLERYVECPFAYFLRYNLLAGERKIYGANAADTGNLFHSVLQRFAERLAEAQKPWRELQRREMDEIVDACVDELSAAPGAGVFFSSARYKYMLLRIRRICKCSVWALAEHIKRGQFEPLGAEMAFSRSVLTGIDFRLNGDRKMVLNGRMDRVDIMDSEGRRYVKIIDYKSGNAKFDLDNVCFGTQLQLLLYLNALLQNSRAFFGDNLEVKLLPGGVFYFNINDPIISVDQKEKDPDADDCPDKRTDNSPGGPTARAPLEEMCLKTF